MPTMSEIVCLSCRVAPVHSASLKDCALSESLSLKCSRLWPWLIHSRIVSQFIVFTPCVACLNSTDARERGVSNILGLNSAFYSLGIQLGVIVLRIVVRGIDSSRCDSACATCTAKALVHVQSLEQPGHLTVLVTGRQSA